jgi:transcriptional regulator with XRE-family HTH domain
VNSKDAQFFKAMGARMASARKAQHRTQQQVADQLGIAQQTLAHYEVGRLRPPASILPPMAEALGLTLEELLGHEVNSGVGKHGPTPKLLKQFERISQLPRATQKVVMNMLDGVLAQAVH